MHRRNFLKLVGLTGGMAVASGSAAAGVAQAASGAGVVQNPDALGVLHDSALCVGCRQCEAACATVNNRPLPARPFDDLSVLEKKRRTSTAGYTVVNKYEPAGQPAPLFRKQQCNHCLEPACASACFVKAFVKNADGSVTYNPKLCVGCRYCMVACPFSMPSYDYDKVLNPLVHKCTLCAPRLREGKRPGCVDACPNGALLFGKRNELLRIARSRILQAPESYVDHIYGEHEAGGTSWLYLSPVPHERLGQPVLGKTSVPELTAGALGAVPIIAGLWPVFLGGAYGISRRREKIAAEEQARAVAEAVNAAEETARAATEAALAKAEKNKEAALAKAAKDQEAALAASEKALKAEMEKVREEAAQQVEEARTKAAKTATAKKPAKKSGHSTAKPAAKAAPGKTSGTNGEDA